MLLDEAAHGRLAVVEPSAGPRGRGPGIGHASVGPGLGRVQSQATLAGLGGMEQRRHVEPHGPAVLPRSHGQLGGQGIPGPIAGCEWCAARFDDGCVADARQSHTERSLSASPPLVAANDDRMARLLLGGQYVVAPQVKLRAVVELDEGTQHRVGEHGIASLRDPRLLDPHHVLRDVERGWIADARRLELPGVPMLLQPFAKCLPAPAAEAALAVLLERWGADVVLRDDLYVGRDTHHAVALMRVPQRRDMAHVVAGPQADLLGHGAVDVPGHAVVAELLDQRIVAGQVVVLLLPLPTAHADTAACEVAVPVQIHAVVAAHDVGVHRTQEPLALVFQPDSGARGVEQILRTPPELVGARQPVAFGIVEAGQPARRDRAHYATDLAQRPALERHSRRRPLARHRLDRRLRQDPVVQVQHGSHQSQVLVLPIAEEPALRNKGRDLEYVFGAGVNNGRQPRAPLRSFLAYQDCRVAHDVPAGQPANQGLAPGQDAILGRRVDARLSAAYGCRRIGDHQRVVHPLGDRLMAAARIGVGRPQRCATEKPGGQEARSTERAYSILAVLVCHERVPESHCITGPRWGWQYALPPSPACGRGEELWAVLPQSIAFGYSTLLAPGMAHGYRPSFSGKTGGVPSKA